MRVNSYTKITISFKFRISFWVTHKIPCIFAIFEV